MVKKSKYDLVEPSEEDSTFFTRTYTNLGEINNKIEELESNVPDKRTKEYQTWMKKVNFLIDLYNKNGNFKAYKKYE